MELPPSLMENTFESCEREQEPASKGVDLTLFALLRDAKLASHRAGDVQHAKKGVCLSEDGDEKENEDGNEDEDDEL